MDIDRTQLSIVDLHDSMADSNYWLRKTPIERLRAIQVHREAAYGRARSSQGLQRVLEVIERS